MSKPEPSQIRDRILQTLSISPENEMDVIKDIISEFFPAKSKYMA